MWHSMHDYMDGNEYAMSVGVSTVIGFALFWLFNIPFIVLDLMQPTWVVNYKIQHKQVVYFQNRNDIHYSYSIDNHKKVCTRTVYGALQSIADRYSICTFRIFVDEMARM
jgi:hypothetical protein